MKKHGVFLPLAAAISFPVLAGCMASTPTSQGAGSDSAESVEMEMVTYQIPENVEVMPQGGDPFNLARYADPDRYLGVDGSDGILGMFHDAPAQIRTRAVSFGEVSLLHIDVRARDSFRQRLWLENVEDTSFLVHRRNDNGRAGSGIQYTVDYSIEDKDDFQEVSFQVVSAETYRQGAIGRFSVPPYDENELRTMLSSGLVFYRFEIDNPYDPDTVYANFRRLLSAYSFRPNHHNDDVAGFNADRFRMPVEGMDVRVYLETFPYREGSKVEGVAILPAPPEEGGVIDFGPLAEAVSDRLEAVVFD